MALFGNYDAGKSNGVNPFIRFGLNGGVQKPEETYEFGLQGTEETHEIGADYTTGEVMGLKKTGAVNTRIETAVLNDIAFLDEMSASADVERQDDAKLNAMFAELLPASTMAYVKAGNLSGAVNRTPVFGLVTEILDKMAV